MKNDMKSILIAKNKSKSAFSIFINGVEVNFDLIETPSISLKDIANSSKLLIVQKKAFSCNFRDRAYALKFNGFLKENINFDGLGIGSEFVADVIEIGTQVSNFKVGDRVIPLGVYGQEHGSNMFSHIGLPTNFASLRFDIFKESHLLRIDNEMTDEVAASFTIQAHTVYSMIRRLSINKVSKILISSAKSNISLGVFSHLKAKNHFLVALTSDHCCINKLKEIGYDKVITSNELNDTDELFDIIIDPFFDLHLERLIQLLNYNGKYITCGILNQIGTSSYGNLTKIGTQLITKNLSIFGNCLGNSSDINQAIADYKLDKFNIIIDSVWKRGEEQKFLHRSFNDINRFGKVVYRY